VRAAAGRQDAEGRRPLEAAIHDLDGVVVVTAVHHHAAR
jgi:NAD(P)H-dependent FMN reductase